LLQVLRSKRDLTRKKQSVADKLDIVIHLFLVLSHSNSVEFVRETINMSCLSIYLRIGYVFSWMCLGGGLVVGHILGLLSLMLFVLGLSRGCCLSTMVLPMDICPAWAAFLFDVACDVKHLLFCIYFSKYYIKEEEFFFQM